MPMFNWSPCKRKNYNSVQNVAIQLEKKRGNTIRPDKHGLIFLVAQSLDALARIPLGQFPLQELITQSKIYVREKTKKMRKYKKEIRKPNLPKDFLFGLLRKKIGGTFSLAPALVILQGRLYNPWSVTRNHHNPSPLLEDNLVFSIQVKCRYSHNFLSSKKLNGFSG